MSINHTMDQLRSLRLHGFAEGLELQLHQHAYAELAFEQRLGMLVEAEMTSRNTAQFKRLLKVAKLKFNADPEDFSYRPDGALDRAVIADLLTCEWINRKQNLIITGKTGTGKTWTACALAVQAARKGISVLYKRIARLLEDMTLAHDDGSIAKLRSQLAKARLLILDDFGLVPLTPRGKSDLLETLDDRVGIASTIILGQMPTKEWHGFINDPALADAILDRLIHSSHKLALKGESMRKIAGNA
ncbi:MAG: AAA family ATPase [Nevskiaceae bacterium]|nr:MAG: AAA family ATPase [Nevskiaceae bacterium]